MRRAAAIDIAGPAGRLEAVLMEPSGPARAAAVVCHAHPLHGGTMHFKVVFRIARGLVREGVAALRFHFRGVGRSEGRFDEGRGEREDVRAALDALEGRYPDRPLLAAGYSFGSVMALAVGGGDERVRAIVAVGFPFAVLEGADALLAAEKPRLVVQGGRDAFGPGPALRARLEGAPPDLELVVLDDADHFFEGRLDALEEAVADWARRRPWEAAP